MEHTDRLTKGGSFRDPETEARFRARELTAMRPLLSRLVPMLGIAFELFAVPDFFVLGPGPEFLIAFFARTIFLCICIAVAFTLRKKPGSGSADRTDDRGTGMDDSGTGMDDSGTGTDDSGTGTNDSGWSDRSIRVNRPSQTGMRSRTFRLSVPVWIRQEGMIGAASIAGSLAFAIIVFLYRNGNFYLQAMSVLLMVAALFLLPNRLPLSCALAFIICGSGIASMAFIETAIQPREIFAVFVDFALAATIGALASWRTARAHRLEFSRTEELERISGTDPLTGLANRRAFEKKLREVLEKIKTEGIVASLGVFDLDNLKAVNDLYGHEAGDAVLQETANLLIGCMDNEGCAARWGGDEIVFVLEYANLTEASGFAERLRETLESGRSDRGTIVTASFGVTLLKIGDDCKKAIARADKALYRAKTSGKNRVVSVE